VFLFFLLLSLPLSVLQWHHEGGNIFSEYDQFNWLFYVGYYLELIHHWIIIQLTSFLPGMYMLSSDLHMIYYCTVKYISVNGNYSLYSLVPYHTNNTSNAHVIMQIENSRYNQYMQMTDKSISNLFTFKT
jgi:hypothetical protein